MSSRKIAFIAVLVGALLTSSAAAITKKGLEEIPPMTLASLRFFVASLCILPFFGRW